MKTRRITGRTVSALLRLARRRKLLAILAGASLVFVVTLSAMIATWGQAIVAPPDLQSVAVRGESHLTLERHEAEDRVVKYLALRHWYHTAMDQARNPAEGSHHLAAYIMSQPNAHCAAQYRETSLSQGDLALEFLEICAAQSLAQDEAQDPAHWTEMSPAEREARLRQQLQLLWRAQSPETHAQTALAYSQGMDVDRGNNEEFQAFAEVYDVCPPQGYGLAPEMAAAADETELAALWLEAESKMRQCQERITASLFEK